MDALAPGTPARVTRSGGVSPLLAASETVLVPFPVEEFGSVCQVAHIGF